jgi:hypothetical protein
MLARAMFFQSKLNFFLFGLIALITFACTMSVTRVSSLTSPVVWVVPSLQRIGQTEEGNSVADIQLYAARGEYESFQIAIKASENELSNVNVSVSDLLGENEQIIPKTNITLYREHYVEVVNPSPVQKDSSNLPSGPGWYPDALIPFVDPETGVDIAGAELEAVPFNLSSGSNQPIWVDVFVPPDAQPGNYQGTYTVTSDGGTFSGKVSLKVWNFQLPLKPSLKSSFFVWEAKSKSTFVELLKHKIMPGEDINPTEQRELIDRWGLNSVRLPFFSGANRINCKMKQPPSVEEIKAAAAENESDLFQYVYSADEIDECPNLEETMKDWALNIKRAGLEHLAVMTPVPELSNPNFFNGKPAVGIWVILPRIYEAAIQKVSEVLENKGQVWFYTALAQDGYSPKWLIDYEPINFRIPHGFINQSLGLTGVLYWRVDAWTDDPWNNVDTEVKDDLHYPGEGMLVYPGEQVGIQGVVPSMRLKWLRDGVEDYEYIEILKKLGRGDWALGVTREVGRDWKNWRKNSNILLEARQKLGEEIEKVGSI